MKLIWRRLSILSIFLTILTFQTKQECENLCYTHTITSTAFCNICYHECSHTTEAPFRSCRYENAKINEFKDLTESQCYPKCYLEVIENIEVVSQLSEKLIIESEPEANPTLSTLTSEDFKKELEREQRKADLIVFVMVISCVILTVLVIIFIIRCFNEKNKKISTVETVTFTTSEELAEPYPEEIGEFAQKNSL